MLEELSGFADPLSALNRQELDAPSKKIAVEILAQLLATLSVTTKSIKQRRPGGDRKRMVARRDR